MIENEMHPVTDPRDRSGFQPAFFPLSDLGDPPPANPPGRNDRIRLSFLSVYYELNIVAASLLTGEIASEEKERLKQKHSALKKIRDDLEDFYAPLGVIAEATFVEDFAANIDFTFPNESRWFQQRQTAGPREAELRFSIPKPQCQE